MEVLPADLASLSFIHGTCWVMGLS